MALTRSLQRLSQNTTSTQELSYQIKTSYLKLGYQVNPEDSLLHCKVAKDCFNDFMSNTDEILEPSN